MEALDNQVERLIAEVNNIKAERDESNHRYMNVYISVTSILGNTVELQNVIG